MILHTWDKETELSKKSEVSNTHDFTFCGKWVKIKGDNKGERCVGIFHYADPILRNANCEACILAKFERDSRK